MYLYGVKGIKKHKMRKKRKDLTWEEKSEMGRKFHERQEKKRINLAKKLEETWEVDSVPGNFHYNSFGPGHTTWENWKTHPITKSRDFGKFESVQKAKKAFLDKFPMEGNYYLWSTTGRRLIRNGKPFMLVGNDLIYKL